MNFSIEMKKKDIMLYHSKVEKFIFYNQLDNLKQSITDMNNLKIMDKYNKNIIHYCVINDNIDALDIIFKNDINNKLNINKKDKYDNTPLFYAIRKKNIEMIKKLLEYKADINMESNNEYLLNYAILLKDKNIIKILLESDNIDVNKKNINLNNSLQLAIKYYPDIIKLLLSKNININNMNIFKQNALTFCIEENNIEYFETLLNNNICYDILDYCKRDLFYYSIKSINEYFINRFFDLNLNINNIDIYNNTNLHYAIKFNLDEDIIIKIINKTNDVNIYNNDNKLPLHYAILNKNINIINKLLNKSSDVILKRYNKKYILFIIENDSISDYSELLNYQCNLDIVDENNNSILHLLIKNKNTKLALKIINKKNKLKFLNINYKNNNNETPIHYAIKYNNINIIKELLKIGCNIFIQDDNDKTAFEYLAVKSPKLLIEHDVFNNLDLTNDKYLFLYDLYCNKTFLFHNIDINLYNHEECYVCYKKFKLLVNLTCKHDFCITCYSKWLVENYTCPLCREEI
jgi:ankyrin repeat protein